MDLKNNIYNTNSIKLLPTCAG